MTEFSPLVTPFIAVTVTPSQTLYFILMERGILERESSKYQSESAINLLVPQRTFFSNFI